MALEQDKPPRLFLFRSLGLRKEKMGETTDPSEELMRGFKGAIRV